MYLTPSVGINIVIEAMSLLVFDSRYLSATEDLKPLDQMVIASSPARFCKSVSYSGISALVP